MTELFITQDGCVHAVNDSFVDTLDLGEKQVTRMSNVEFNNELQLWEAHIFETNQVIRGKTRQEVIDAEINIVNQQLQTALCS